MLLRLRAYAEAARAGRGARTLTLPDAMPLLLPRAPPAAVACARTSTKMLLPRLPGEN